MKQVSKAIIVLYAGLSIAACGVPNANNTAAISNSSIPASPAPKPDLVHDLSAENLGNLCADGKYSEFTAVWVNSPSIKIFDAIRTSSSKPVKIGDCVRANKNRGGELVNSGNSCSFVYDFDANLKASLNFPNIIKYELVTTKYGQVINFQKGYQPGLVWVDKDGHGAQQESFLFSAACLKADGTGGFFVKLGKGVRVMELNP